VFEPTTLSPFNTRETYHPSPGLWPFFPHPSSLKKSTPRSISLLPGGAKGPQDQKPFHLVVEQEAILFHNELEYCSPQFDPGPMDSHFGSDPLCATGFLTPARIGPTFAFLHV